MTVDKSVAWKALDTLAEQLYKDKSLADLFAEDKQRAERFTLEIPSILLDYSKNRLDEKVLAALFALADQQKVADGIRRLFAGEKVNFTEDRAALHTDLRAIPGKNKLVDVQLEKMEHMVEQIRRGQWRGYSGQPITDVVNIGVGGSDLGPMMAVHALDGHRKGVRVHFVSSIDGAQIRQLIRGLDPQCTLFVVASKSFTTIDTLSNAQTAKEWLVASAGTESLILNQHFIGITAASERASEWGIPEDNQLLFWDWVGGRYSMWSCIGLVIAVAIGMSAFREILAGARQMDAHFRERPLKENMPVIMALINIWNVNFLGINAKSLLPYDARLKYLPSYLQQLIMESNGKSVNDQGQQISYETCPLIWGEVGPNAQHAFYQLLHQGTQAVACDFIIPVSVDQDSNKAQGKTADNLATQHELAISNCLAQSRVLMLGDAAVPASLAGEFTGPHRSYPGNQPSNTLLLDQISPATLGLLIALYEHVTYVEGLIWEINPFDQWGVELGKKIASSIHQMIKGEAEPVDLDASTETLLRRFMK